MPNTFPPGTKVPGVKGVVIPGWNPADAMYADVLPYYPSQKYIDKNLAPEQYPKESIKAAARATRRAVDAGVISPSLATLVLPNQLVEGRPDDFGVRGGNRWPGGVNAPIGKIVKKLGLEDATVVKKDVDINEILSKVQAATGIGSAVSSAVPMYKKGDVVITSKQGENPAELEHNARLMTAVLAEKARQAGGDDLETVKRWNGQGKGAENHLSKVMEMSELLKDPKNSQVLDLFKQEFMKDPVTPDPTKGTM